MVENVALSLANGARKPNFTPAECAVIFQFSTTLSNKNKSRNVTSMFQITYVVFRMQLLNLLHVPWKRNTLLVLSGKVRGKSISSLDEELWKENKPIFELRVCLRV